MFFYQHNGKKNNFVSRKFFCGRRIPFKKALKTPGKNSLCENLGMNFLKLLAFVTSNFLCFKEYSLVCRINYY